MAHEKPVNVAGIQRNYKHKPGTRTFLLFFSSLAYFAILFLFTFFFFFFIVVVAHVSDDETIRNPLLGFFPPFSKHANNFTFTFFFFCLCVCVCVCADQTKDVTPHE